MNFTDADHGETATEIEALERAWMGAWLTRDLALCQTILDDTFILTSATGVLVNKEMWLQHAAGNFSGTEFTWHSVAVRKLSDTVAVAHCKSSQKATIGEKDWSGIFLLTDVWVKRADGWKVAARQGLGPLTEG